MAPAIIFKSVVLPAPSNPNKPRHSWRLAENETSLITLFLFKYFVRLLISIIMLFCSVGEARRMKRQAPLLSDIGLGFKNGTFNVQCLETLKYLNKRSPTFSLLPR